MQYSSRIGRLTLLLLIIGIASSCSTSSTPKSSDFEEQYDLVFSVVGNQRTNLEGDPYFVNGVYLASLSGGQPKLIVQDIFASDLDLSPDGKRLVFTTFNHSNNSSQIELIDIAKAISVTDAAEIIRAKELEAVIKATRAKGKSDPVSGVGTQAVERYTPSVLLPSGRFQQILNPSWSPDGTKILFSTQPLENDIYTLSADGQQLNQLTQTASNDYWPQWSPDGSKVVFISDRGGDTEIFTMNADGSEQSQVSAVQSGGAWFPSWSPDGQEIAFTVNPESGVDVELRIVDSSGNNQRKIETQSIWCGIGWSPDGSKIIFDAFTGGETQLFIVNRDGSGLHSITDVDTSKASCPLWSKKLDKIIFRTITGGKNSVEVIGIDGSNRTSVLMDLPTSAQTNAVGGRWLR